MPNNAAAKAQRIERREKVWRLRIQGKTERDIANELGTVSNITVHNDLKYLIQEATKHLDDEVKRERLFQLYTLRMIIKEAFEAWIKSKEIGGQIVERKIPPSKANRSERIEVITTTYEQTGNPAYLHLIRGAMQDIRDLFGLDAFKDDWEGELKAAGLNPVEIFETMVQSAYAAMTPDGSNALDTCDQK